MLYQHPEPGPTWQQSAQRAARLEPGRRQQQTRLVLRLVRSFIVPIIFGYLWEAMFGEACTTTDYLSRVFILHQYRVSLTWPGLVFYDAKVR